MQISSRSYILSIIATLIFFSACKDSVEQYMLASFAQGDTGRCYTTLQVDDSTSTLFTDGEELLIDELLGLPASSKGEEFTVDYDNTEIEELYDTWDINISSNSIVFRKSENNTGFFTGYERVIDSGSYERYYFDFDESVDLDNIYLPEDIKGLNIEHQIVPVPRLIVKFSEGFDTEIHQFRIDFDN